MDNTNDCQQIEPLLSGYMDGELTQQESQRVSRHLHHCQTCKTAYEELKAMQNMIKQSSYQNMDETQLNHVVDDLTSKNLMRISWIVLITGFAFLIALVGFEFWVSTSLSGFEKLIISLILAGGIGLFLSVLRQRLKARKSDKYRRVKL